MHRQIREHLTVDGEPRLVEPSINVL